MTEAERFRRWRLEEKDLREIDAEKARDLIVKCFYEAQRETFARSRQSLGLEAEEESLKASVLTTIKQVFKEIDEEYDNPTRQSLSKIVEVLGRKSVAWGTPRDIIEYHRHQIMKVIDGLQQK